jgi:hypothetical protein
MSSLQLQIHGPSQSPPIKQFQRFTRRNASAQKNDRPRHNQVHAANASPNHAGAAAVATRTSSHDAGAA